MAWITVFATALVIVTLVSVPIVISIAAFPGESLEARLACNHLAAPIGQLPLCKERAVSKLKSGGQLGDVDIDRGPAEYAGCRERKLGVQPSDRAVAGRIAGRPPD